MMTGKGTTLKIYGVIITLLGLALIFWNPVDGKLGLYMTAKTGLIAALVFALPSLLFGFLLQKGVKWALWAGVVWVFLALSGFSMQSKKLWGKVEAEPHKFYGALVTTLMAAVSLPALISLVRGLAFAQPVVKPKK